MNIDIREHEDGLTIECHITPKSKKSSIKGERAGALSISLTAPPVDGKANTALIKFISKLTGRPRSSIAIIKGEHNRSKTLYIQGISRKELDEVIHNSIP